jgi:hypothetical protein
MDRFWIYWLAAFMIILAFLTIGVCIQEALAWRREGRK